LKAREAQRKGKYNMKTEDKNILKDNPESIPDMYNEDAFRFDMDRKEHDERWDR